MVAVLEEDVDESQGHMDENETRSQEASLSSHEDSQYEIILPVEESITDYESVNLAIQTARNLSGRLMILYITSSTHVPTGFIEFAKAERIRDYQWHYYSSLVNEKVAWIAKRAEEKGIETKSHIHLGSIKSVIRDYARGERVILILNMSRKMGQMKSFRNLKLGDLQKHGLFVLIV